ncbi:uncharacterized protein ColSpa_01049 [Colletotrichum spaethianum]|uniref:Uncharacterized protein n=1 Tax=Colletotrichum spaethianum TaxID=700344 RepID=A0AA37NY84_9PEZI|nr:uncharacterized protein ColSpa_01049 [Colletotrichum spaethianum]GKT40868.1 hypothetical protein ColSpa_01049 [Colletotrichum spaethianum]
MEGHRCLAYMNSSEVVRAKPPPSLKPSSFSPFRQLFDIDLDQRSKQSRKMPRPTPDRVFHDCTFVTLPLTMVFVLLIFTVLALVYSIGVKTPIPEDLAIAFAGIVCGLFGLWMIGHLGTLHAGRHR